ncbi:MAG: hypothetical protein AAF596_01040 [Planctomycetota bacterium]
MFDQPIQFAAYRLMLAAIVTAGAFGAALAVGINAPKTALFTAAFCLAAFSLLAVKQIAQQGDKIDAQRQLVILLAMEFLFVPLAMLSATVGYLWDRIVI